MNTTQSSAQTKSSTKLLREWSGEINVGIYEHCTWTVRLYEDRAIVRMPGVKWTGNTGGYHLYRFRVDHPRDLKFFTDRFAREQADGEDYTDDLLWDAKGAGIAGF